VGILGWPLGEDTSIGLYCGSEENFSSKFTVSNTLSIPSSCIAFLKKLFLVGVAGLGVTELLEGINALAPSPIILLLDVLFEIGDAGAPLPVVLICAGVGPSTNLPGESGSLGSGSVGRLTKCFPGEFGRREIVVGWWE